jgi:hypothetical protein
MYSVNVGLTDFPIVSPASLQKDIVSIVHLKRTDECYVFCSVWCLLTHMLAYLFFSVYNPLKHIGLL